MFLVTDHIMLKHKLQKINNKREFEELLDSVTISTKDKDLMRMKYIEEYDFYFIADKLGYSRSGVIKRHSKILKKLSNRLSN